MKKLILLSLLGIIFTGNQAAVAMPPHLTAGDWEFEVNYDLIGISQTFPNYTIRECINKENPFPGISRPGHECNMTMQGHFGNTYTWLVNCSTEWEMVQGMGRIHYFNNTARGDVHLQILNPHNRPQPMVFHIEGKYVGPCNKQPE